MKYNAKLEIFQQVEDVMKEQSSIFAPKKNRKAYDDVSPEQIERALPTIRPMIAFWRAYPDIFIDQVMKPKNSNFEFFFYQRLLLRAFARNRYVFATFTRAFSKSFLGILFQMIKCLLYPGAKVFIVAGSKEQAASIAREKVEEIFELFPAFRYETYEKKIQFQKDYVRVPFKNGSKFDVVGALESTRGGRRHSGIIEEVILVNGELLNSVILPLMNVNRRAACGGVDPNEVHKQQLYVTTAGYKDTFSYDKLIQILLWQITKGSAFILGGDYKIPVAHGLLEKDFTNEMREDGTFNEVMFDREYGSIWAGSAENSYFDSEMIDKIRTLEEAEWFNQISTSNSKTSAAMQEYYAIGIDVARMSGKKGAQTVAAVVRVKPQISSSAVKELVNIFVWEGEHFESQALQIKNLREDYNAKVIVIDANGSGVGLVDYLIKPSVKQVGGDDGGKNFVQIAPPLEVINDERYDIYSTDDSIPCLYNLKATNEMNHDIAVNVVSQLSSKKVKLLSSEKVIKTKLLNDKKTKTMSASDRTKLLKPFMLTSILKDEMMNLREDYKKDSRYSNFKRVNSKIGKDKYSAFSYVLYWIKLEEDKNFGKKKKKSNLIDAVMYSESRDSFLSKNRRR